MDDLDALLADLESTSSPLARCPVLLTSDPPAASDPAPASPQDNAQTRPPPPAYTPQQTVSAAMKSNGSQNPNPDKQLYSTVNKPRSPRTADPPPPAFSSSSVLGGGLSELDHLLQELNATQFNITDEILAQFPTTKKDERDKIKEFQGSKDKVTTPYPSSVKPSATSATLELDKLMASLSDFRVQSTNATEFKTVEPQSHAVYCDVRRPPLDNSQLNEPAPAVTPVITVPQHSVPPPQASSGGSLDSMLGLLQSDLTRQGVPTSSKGSCSACQKPVVGQVVTALGRVWHPEHFVCSECETELGSRNFFEKDGQPYCESDYFTLYSPHCAHCNKPILNVSMTARVSSTASSASCPSSPPVAKDAPSQSWRTTSLPSTPCGTRSALCAGSATAPSSTAASSSTRASRCARPTTTSRAAACARHANSPSWAAASPPWVPNSTRTTWCATSASSPSARAVSKSRRTSPTATPASSNSLAEHREGCCPSYVFFFHNSHTRCRSCSLGHITI
uniref:Transforming growth factor beta 1 induced transcript 1 n=1 Tax=Salmo trutta TaxID=8032 RepID=A0A674DRX1_SALTR